MEAKVALVFSFFLSYLSYADGYCGTFFGDLFKAPGVVLEDSTGQLIGGNDNNFNAFSQVIQTGAVNDCSRQTFPEVQKGKDKQDRPSPSKGPSRGKRPKKGRGKKPPKKGRGSNRRPKQKRGNRNGPGRRIRDDLQRGGQQILNE